MVEEPKRVVREIKADEGKYFVSHLDILGYKSLVRQSSGISTLVSLFRVVNIQESYKNGIPSPFIAYYDVNTGQLRAQQIDVEIKKLHFTNYSDTIIMYFKRTEDKDENNHLFKLLCKASNFLISKLILSNKLEAIKSIALRFGIAYGHGIVCEDIDLHTGEVFIDAFELCENQRWMGGAIHPNIPEEYCQPLVGYNNELYSYEGKIPLKKECIPKPKYALNWVNSHPALPPWYPLDKRNREGPLLLDIGSHIKNFTWEEKSEYDRTHNTTFDKAYNTLGFVVEIDKAWNNKCGVPKSTPDDFVPPSWYRS